MLRRHAKAVEAVVSATDLLLTVGTFLATHRLLDRSRLFGPIDHLGDYLPLLFFSVPAWAFLLRVNGIYQSRRTAPWGREIGALARAVSLGGLVQYAFLAVTLSDDVSRAFVGAFLVLNWAALVLFRVALRAAARTLRERGRNQRSLLLVGTGPTARSLARRCEENRHWGVDVLGFLADAPGAAPAGKIDGHPVLGDVRDLPRLLREKVVDEVVIAVGGDRLPDMRDIILHCEEVGVTSRLALDIFPARIARASYDELDGTPVMTFTTAPRDVWALAMKRAIDIAGSGLFLLAFSWLYLIIAIAVKATSPGPIFFRQQRVGLRGRRFTFYKFRSMVPDAEARRAELVHLNEMDGPVFKIKRDPRITPVGRILRKYSLDELPQMWNVLKGDMSLVGPRPPIPSEVESYEGWQRRRFSVKPGLTCLWQVSGRNEVGFKRWMEMDLEYIDTWSLALDLKILLKTVPVVVTGRGAS
jgi:exopolysaccharide biosynthesis polyprenyl glycosylphosphotransferase